MAESRRTRRRREAGWWRRRSISGGLRREGGGRLGKVRRVRRWAGKICRDDAARAGPKFGWANELGGISSLSVPQFIAQSKIRENRTTKYDVSLNSQNQYREDSEVIRMVVSADVARLMWHLLDADKIRKAYATHTCE